MPKKAKVPANKVDPRLIQGESNKDNAVTILNDYFAGIGVKTEEELFAELKTNNLLNEKLWESLNKVQNIDQAFRSKVFDALILNKIRVSNLDFYQDSEKEFLNEKIKTLLEEGKKDEVSKLLPAYAKFYVGQKDKVLYTKLMEDNELGSQLIQSTVKLLTQYRGGYFLEAEALVKHDLVTPDLLVACYAEYLSRREESLRQSNNMHRGEDVQYIEGSFRILQHSLLNGKVLDSNSAYAIAIGKFSEDGGKKNYEGLVKSTENLPKPSDIVKNYDIDVLNKMLSVRRRGSEEMNILDRIIATIKECIEFIFGGGVRKEIVDAVKAELGMHTAKGTERGGRH